MLTYGPVLTSFQVDIEIYEDKLGQSGDRILSSHITMPYSAYMYFVKSTLPIIFSVLPTSLLQTY